MPPVVWTTNALAGLRRLYAFLAEKDRAAVRRAMGFMYDKARLLGDYPNAGRPAEELEPEHRELLVTFGASGYVLFYCYDHDAGVTVLSVRHQLEAGFSGYAVC
jgi:plasmid stabilization system protein ParE